MWKYIFFFGFVACGAARELVAPRIIGGESAQIKQFPHQLSVALDGKYLCGAAVIKSTYAITTAHCLIKVVGTLTIRSGSSKAGDGGTLHNVANVISHPSFNPTTRDYDVALLRIADSFEYSSTTQPIYIATTSPAAGEVVTVSGWGATSENSSATVDLNAVTISVVDTLTCTDAYLAQNRPISSSMLCAGENGRGACDLDDGSPLILGDNLVGLMSWGMGCARAGLPGVYTNLADTNILLWLLQTVS